MQIIQAPPQAGLQWIGLSFRLLFRQPLPLLACTFLFMLLMALISIMPLLGGLLFLVTTPIFLLGLIHAARVADRGQRPTPAHLFAAFKYGDRRSLAALVSVGLIHGATTLLALLASSLADGGTFLKVMTGAAPPELAAQLNDSAMVYAALLFLALYVPTQMALWFAPMFIAWHGMAVGQSLFYSFFALWRNKWAYLTYLIGWMAVMFATSLAARIVARLLGDGRAALSLLLSPITLVLLSAILVSIWVTYRETVRDAGAANASA